MQFKKKIKPISYLISHIFIFYCNILLVVFVKNNINANSVILVLFYALLKYLSIW